MVLLLTIGDLHIPLRTHDLPAKFKKLLVPGKIGQIVCTGNVCDRETWEYLRSVAPDVRGVRGDFDETPNLPPSLVVQHGPLRIGVIHGHQIVPLGDTEALAAAARKLDVDVLVTGGTHRFEAYEFESKFFINPGSATGAFHTAWPLSPLIPSPSAAASTLDAATPSTSDDKELRAAEDTTGVRDWKAEADEKEDGAAKEAAPSPATNSTAEAAAGPPELSIPAEAADSLYPPGPIPSFALLDIQGPVVVTYTYRLIEGEVKVEKFEYRKEMQT